MSIRTNQIVRIESKRHTVSGALCLHVFRSTAELAPLLAMIPGHPLRRRVKRAAWFAYADYSPYAADGIVDFIALETNAGEWYETDGRHLSITQT